MTPEAFCYWLHGFFEIRDARERAATDPTLSASQVAMIRKHLELVFTNVTSEPVDTTAPLLSVCDVKPLTAEQREAVDKMIREAAGRIQERVNRRVPYSGRLHFDPNRKLC